MRDIGVTGVQTCALPISGWDRVYISSVSVDYEGAALEGNHVAEISQSRGVDSADCMMDLLLEQDGDRKSVVSGKSVDLGGRRIINIKHKEVTQLERRK